MKNRREERRQRKTAALNKLLELYFGNKTLINLAIGPLVITPEYMRHRWQVSTKECTVFLLTEDSLKHNVLSLVTYGDIITALAKLRLGV